MRIVTVVGARPQFVKAACVSRELRAIANVEETIVHTGQHHDANMSAVFFRDMDIPAPRYNLGIHGGSHGQMTGRQLEALERVIMMESPDWVMVYGDTNSTLAGALAAAKLNIPVAHVEAGLRSFNRRMPEEVNRVLTDHISTLLFAPTPVAAGNLADEGIEGVRIAVVGDVMLDAALFYGERAVRPSWWTSTGMDGKAYVLCTVHRAENTNSEERLRNILHGLEMSGASIIMPLHPRTRETLASLRLSLPHNVMGVEPVGYLEMIWLERHCKLIATDSGGVQKEAYFHGKPCVTLRDETEWVELVDAGANVLTGADPVAIAAAIRDSSRGVQMPVGLYGDGRTGRAVARRIAGFRI